jgi:UDP-N-acetylmuramoylalanine--D-glutamate ligase
MRVNSVTLGKVKKSIAEGNKVGIIGLGKENCQFLEWAIAVANFEAKDFVLFDKNKINLEGYPSLKFLENKFQKVEGEEYLDVLKSSNQIQKISLSQWGLEGVFLDYLIKSPGIWSLNPVFEEYREIKGEDKIISSLVFFFEKYREQIVAITGTKGKSTTSGLTNCFLNANQQGIQSFYCGNTTNISPYRFWTELESEIDPKVFFVIEISSFQLQDLGYSKISPKYAVITNLYIDHLDQHLNVSEYWSSKFNIFKFQEEGDFFCLNEETLSKISDNKKYVSLSVFSIKNSKDFYKTDLVGDHNLQNIWMASKVASKVLEVNQYNSDFQDALDEFKNFPHRLELVNTKEITLKSGSKIEVNFYDDGAASEPEAVLAGVQALTQDPDEFLWLQLTGKDKGGVLDSLVEEILSNESILRVDFCGQVGKRVYEESSKLANSRSTENLTKLKDVSSFSTPGQNFRGLIESDFEKSKFEEILDKLEKNHPYPLIINVLLSPCGSSFDEFNNYDERAKWWVKKIQNLIKA